MIELKNITKTYATGRTGVQALKEISLKINAGEFIAIMGPSGSGKSTLMHILGLLDRPSSGSYYLAGKDITTLTDNELAVLRNNLLGFIFQQFHLLPRLTALGNAELPLIYAGKRLLKEKARAKIEAVGLGNRQTHWPNELSGGEQQRVAIARSLVNEPLILMADEPTGNLDTKSEEEIMKILKALNQQGKTIIMVTHEEEVAQYTERIIRMRDGKIISDKKNEQMVAVSRPLAEKSQAETNKKISIDNILNESRSSGKKAEIIDHVRQAGFAIISHKMRSFLSILGILIGVAAVIAMLALGQGAKESIEQRLASLGSNLLIVRSGSPRMGGVSLGAGAVTRLTLTEDVEAVAKLPQVKKVAPAVSGRVQVVYGNKNWNTQVQGTGVDYVTMRLPDFKVGRFFNNDELRTRSKVVLIGWTLVRELFGDTDPIGEKVKINHIDFQVIGILPSRGADMWHDQDDLVIIPVTTAMYRLLGKQYVDEINIEVAEAGLMEEAQNVVQKTLIKAHNLKEGDKDSFTIRNMSQIQDVLSSTTQTMSWLLGCIAAISLLVGGIGIMNIMLVSVKERTKEIGLRKAIGARAKDILIQFLIEAVVMSFSGGIIGIMLGTGIATLLSVFAGWATKVSILAIIMATAFSVTVGIVFGLWPARQASKLNPIEALRYE